MTRALSIPPDAAARMLMLVSHDKKSQQTRGELRRNSVGGATVPSPDNIAETPDSTGPASEVRVTET